MRDLLAADGIQGLVYWNAGMKHMSMRDPMRTPAQASKLVLANRLAGPADDHFRSIDVYPTPVAADKLYNAMTSGQVGALEGTWQSLFTSRSYEVHRTAMQTNHGIDGSMVVISGTAWGALKAAGRDQLFQILWALSQEQSRRNETMQQDHLKRIGSSGGRVDELTEPERMQWVDALRPSWDRGAGTVGEKVLAAALVAAGY
jgi:C4-dicarboxylate-binding protein DctP